jgi:hypothetical protein
MQVMVIATQNAVERRVLGIATGVLNFSRTIGATVGVAALGAVLTHRLHALLAGSPLAARDARVLVEPAALSSLPPDAVVQLRSALASALHGVFLLGVPVAVALLVVTLLLRELPLRTTAHIGLAEEMAPLEPAPPAPASAAEEVASA